MAPNVHENDNQPGPSYAVRPGGGPDNDERAINEASRPGGPGYDPGSENYDPRRDPSHSGYNSRNDPNSSNYYDATKDPNSRYYINRADSADSGQDVHQHQQSKYDQQVAAKEDELEKQFGGLFPEPLRKLIARAMLGDDTVNKGVQQELSQQAKQLAQGLNTRPAPTMPSSVYKSVEHAKLATMVSERAAPSDIGERSQKWTTAGDKMVGFQNTVSRAINNSEANWSGAAGDNARTFMANVGNWVGKVGQGASLTGTQMSLHSEALSTAKNSMPPPPDKPFSVEAANADLMSTTDPVQAMTKRATYLAEMQKQQADQQKAAQVMHDYDNKLGGATTTPAFSAPPQFSTGGKGKTLMKKMPTDSGGGKDTSIYSKSNGGGGGIHQSSTPGGGGGGYNGGGNFSGGGGGGGFSGGGGGNGGGSGGNGGGVGTIPRPGGTVGTNPSYAGGGTVPSYTGGGFQPTGNGGGFGNTGAGNNGLGGMPMGMPMGGGGFGGDTVRPGSGFGGTGGGSGFGAGGSGGYGSGGSGGYGSGGAGGFGPRGSGGFSSGSGGGFGPGGSAGAAAAEQAALRGGAAGGFGPGGAAGAAGGRGGGMPMGGAGAGSGGDKDGEHKANAYLVEPDADEIFGTDQMTAPPVIGE